MSFKKVGFIQDRFTQGLIAGLIGWFPQVLFMRSMHFLKIAKFQYLDFTAVLAFNHQPKNLPESLFTEFLVLSLMGVFGAFFALLVKMWSSYNLRLKGAIYGGGVWFSLYVLITLYKMAKIYGKIDFPNAMVNLIGAVIYGFFMAWALLILNRKYDVVN